MMIKDHQTPQNHILQEMETTLRKDGFKTELSDDSLTVLMDDHPLCKITDNGSVRYHESDIRDEERNDALHRVIDHAKTVSEYMSLMESASPLSASSLDESYKLLADFNGTVLAGHPTKRGVEFVTWDWDFNRVGVNHGHYMGNDYEAAKQDFALRSGLVAKEQIFSPEQLTEIYRCIQDTLEHGYDMTCEQEEILKGTQEQIAELVPDLSERISHAQQTEESAFSQPIM